MAQTLSVIFIHGFYMPGFPLRRTHVDLSDERAISNALPGVFKSLIDVTMVFLNKGVTSSELSEKC